MAFSACTPEPTTVPTPTASETRTGPRGEVVFGIVGDAATLDPHSRFASDLTYALLRPVYPSLFRFAPDGTAVPYLAQSVRTRSGMARVNLRRLFWSDGTRITARDVVASWRRARAPSGFARIDRAEARGPGTVVFRGTPQSLRRALATVAFVLPRGRAIGRCTSHTRSSCRMISGGPWTIAGRVPGLELVYRPNPAWGGEDPALRRVTVRSYESVDPLLVHLASGRVDAAWPPATVNLPQRLDEKGLEHEQKLGWESVRLTFVHGRTSLGERAALLDAIDKPALHEGFVRELGRVTDTLGPGPGARGAQGPWRAPIGPRDRPEDPLTVAIPTGDELLYLVSGAMQVQARRAEIPYEPASVELRTLYGEWQRSAPVDALLERRAGGPGMWRDAPARRTLSRIPLLHVATMLAWRPGVFGLEVNPTVDGPLWNMERWTLTPDL